MHKLRISPLTQTNRGVSAGVVIAFLSLKARLAGSATSPLDDPYLIYLKYETRTTSLLNFAVAVRLPPNAMNDALNRYAKMDHYKRYFSKSLLV